MLNIRNVVMIINSMNVEDWQDIIGFVVNCELPFYPFMCVKWILNLLVHIVFQYVTVLFCRKIICGIHLIAG